MLDFLYNQYLEELVNELKLFKTQDDFIMRKINPKDIKSFAEKLKYDILKSKEILNNILKEMNSILQGQIYKLPNGNFLYINDDLKPIILEEYK